MVIKKGESTKFLRFFSVLSGRQQAKTYNNETGFYLSFQKKEKKKG